MNVLTKTLNKNTYSNIWKGLKRQKYGWFTMIFYGIGNVFWAYANNLRKIAGARNGIETNISDVAGAFWITVIREFLYVFLFILYAGPGLIKRRFMDTFTIGGRWMLLAVFTNFIGNVMLSMGYVFLVTAAFAGSIETSFIIFTFLGALILFGQKYRLRTYLGMLMLIGFLVGITIVQITHNGVSGDIWKQLVGAILIMLAQIGYMIKNLIGEYVFKKKYLDTEGVQFMATFWSPFIALLGTVVFLPILQPILVLTASKNGGSLISVEPFALFIYMLRMWSIPLIVFIASIFLLSGRNSQYQNTRISGASLSNVFYQAKLIVQTLGTVIAYAILIGITNSAYPVIDPQTSPTDPRVLNPWLLITSTKYAFFALWYYWILLFGLMGSVVFVVLSGQKRFETNQKDYRKKRGIKDEAIDYSTTENKGITFNKKRFRKHKK